MSGSRQAKPNRGPRPFQLLVVCGGNTCRSPMAVGIARLRLGGIAHVESPGIAAYGEGATEEAARTTVPLKVLAWNVGLARWVQYT